MSVAVNSPDLSIDKSSTSFLPFGVRRQGLLLPTTLLAASVAATILCHAQMHFRPTPESRALINSILPVHYSTRGIGKNLTNCTGLLVAGEEWSSILQNADKVRMASYSITEQHIETFQVVSKYFGVLDKIP